MGKKKNKFRFESLDFIRYIWGHRNLLLIIAIAAFIVSSIVSLLITPRFKSSVIMFPATSSSVSKTLLTDAVSSREDLLRFGGEEEGEQLMQVLYSTAIQDRIIRHFNLIDHYKINPKSSNWRSQLSRKFGSNIRFHRTEFMSIVIDVWDSDRNMAANIANEISNQVDSVMGNIQHERAHKAFLIVKHEYEDLEHDIGVIQDSLKKVSQVDLVGFELDSKAYHTAYAKALGAGKTAGAKVLEGKLKVIAEKGGVYASLNQRIINESRQLVVLHEKYREAKIDAEQDIPHKFVVDKAFPADTKDTPKRMIIVLVSVFSSMFFALVILLIKESIINRLKE